MNAATFAKMKLCLAIRWCAANHLRLAARGALLLILLMAFSLGTLASIEHWELEKGAWPTLALRWAAEAMLIPAALLWLGLGHWAAGWLANLLRRRNLMRHGAPIDAVRWAESTIEKNQGQLLAALDKAALEKHASHPDGSAPSTPKRL